MTDLLDAPFAPPIFDPEEPTEEVSPAAGLKVDPGYSRTCPECDEVLTSKFQHGLNRKYGQHMSIKHGIKKPKPATLKPPADPDKPRESRRKSGAELLGLVASGLGSLVGLSSPAAGMALKLEAPLVGPAADKAVAGTVVDRLVVQKALTAKSKFDAIGPLIAFPILVGICEKQPEMRPQLYGPLRMCITPMLSDLVKAMQRQAAEAEKLAKAAKDLSEIDPGFAALFADGVDPVDAILGSLFSHEEPANEAA